MTIGESLKRFRSSLGLSQKRFAEAVGVSCNSYQAWEYNISAPSSKQILKIADKYNVSADYLLGRSDVPNPTDYDEREVREAFAIRDAWRRLQSLPSVRNIGQLGSSGAIAK